jgi:hypothetical protein
MPGPKVFISYTHESQAHKDWAAFLATRLRECGVDVILDQWELTLGTDLTLFMEQAISEADRVLLLCTPTYRQKTSLATGGVGYERLIVTGELAQKLKTDKFICLLRAGDLSSSIPAFALGRLFVDFRDDGEFERSLEALVRDLYRVAQKAKPPLGPSPRFAPAQLLRKSLPESGTWEEWHRLHISKLVCLAPYGLADDAGISVDRHGIWHAPTEMYQGSSERIDKARSFEKSVQVSLTVPEGDQIGTLLVADFTITGGQTGLGPQTVTFNIERGQYELEYSVERFLRRVDGYDTYEDSYRGFSVLIPRRLKLFEGDEHKKYLAYYGDSRLKVQIIFWDDSSLELAERESLQTVLAKTQVAARQVRKYGARQGIYLRAFETETYRNPPLQHDVHIALAPTQMGIVAVKVWQKKGTVPDPSEQELTNTIIQSLSIT